ncbi:hypothetical protein AKJ41_00685 [candidate division MSBL1 archaeon SCGC-AAA259O05]|uniref:PIN domain-containing protein n=1 Tax=candidate division MSBL1 archaeon SCGC-AAA259O05 TaxID=1698271 RepID=A0A133V5I6_9EURY|nr:hypothetical protein AKJ41_00685 [candidate division MSBL1 archaeon SCGC-AAA259O05]
MEVFLDTSALSEPDLDLVTEELEKDPELKFFVSAITHFEILWGYSISDKKPTSYKNFLRTAGVRVESILQSDAETSAEWKPSEKDIRDSLIAASVKRRGASIWTRDDDFLNFLPEDRVKIIA